MSKLINNKTYITISIIVACIVVALLLGNSFTQKDTLQKTPCLIQNRESGLVSAFQNS